MIFVRQPAATAARRRDERVIKAITPMMTARMARPMTIHTHIGMELVPFAVAVALALGGTTGAGAAELLGGDEVTAGTEGVELVAADELVLWAGDELVLWAGGELVLWAGEEMAVWPVVRLEIALLMLLPTLEPHAVTVPAAHRIVVARSRLPIGRRISGPFPHRRRAAGTTFPSLFVSGGDAHGGTPVLCVQPGQSPLAPRHPERMNVARAGGERRQSRDDHHRGFAAV